ncbi:MAG TPA: branched-chain amino acid ABC transporter permease [Pseudolabrys sp.]|jgi:urea transport system permease protein
MPTLILDTVTTAALLFIISSGLLIVFGVMKIINFAHAAFVTVGGYAALVGSRLGLPWALVLPLAFATGAVCGAVTEATIVRWLYQRPLDAILATWGLGIVIGQIITLIFGREVQFVQAPITGTVGLLGVDYSAYRIVMIAAAIIVAVVFTALLSGTRLGLTTRAVIMNEMLAQGLGVDSSRVRLVTFAIGSGLAALSGALITPLSSVDPNMGLPWLISAFMLVMVSGGSLFALAASCVVLGGIQVIVSTFVNPILGGLAIAICAAIVLRIRPEGFARA